MWQKDGIVAVVSLTHSDKKTKFVGCGLCSPIYPDTLSSTITSDQTDANCCSNPESFSQILISCKEQEKTNSVDATKSIGQCICISDGFNWLITIHAYTEFRFAILIRLKRNSQPKALELWIFSLLFSFLFHSAFTLRIPWCSHEEQRIVGGRAGLNMLCLNAVIMIGNEVWTH